MSDLAFPAPWLCAILALVPIGLFAGLCLRRIKPRPFPEVWRDLFAVSVIPAIIITPVESPVELGLLAPASFACMALAWYLGLYVQKSHP